MTAGSPSLSETSAVLDPVLPFIYGHDVTWQARSSSPARGGASPSSAASMPRNVRQAGRDTEVVTYDAAFSEPLRKGAGRPRPQRIALFSATDNSRRRADARSLPAAARACAARPYAERFVSASPNHYRCAARRIPQPSCAHQTGDRYHFRHLPAHLPGVCRGG